MHRLIKIIFYYFSRDRKKLDIYCRLFRKGHKFSDGEIEMLKRLIENEQRIYQSE